MHMISEEEISEIVSTSGEVRGVVFCTDAEYVRRHEGEQALRRVEEETRAMGYPIDYSKVRVMDWYPAGLRAVSLFAIKKALNWGDEQLREMGRAAPKYSIITKLMLRYLVSPETLVDKLGIYWSRNFTVGSLTGKAADRAVSVRLEDCPIPPPALPYMEGYFVGVMSMVIGNDKQIRMEQTKRAYGGGKCYEFILKW